MEIQPKHTIPVTHSLKTQFTLKAESGGFHLPLNERPLGDHILPWEDMTKLVDDANKFFSLTRTHIQFHLHEGLNQYYVEIRNSETDEVIKEVPSKKFLDMVAKLQELAGLIVDEKI